MSTHRRQVNRNQCHLSAENPTQCLNILSTVTMIPAINTKLRISPRIFVKFKNGANGILKGPGETDSLKNLKSKSRVRLPLKFKQIFRLLSNTCTKSPEPHSGFVFNEITFSDLSIDCNRDPTRSKKSLDCFKKCFQSSAHLFYRDQVFLILWL
jgi:hypothetical protein